MLVKDGRSISGWWFQPTPLKNVKEFVSWDDDIPNWTESHNPFMFQTTNQIKSIAFAGWIPRFVSPFFAAEITALEQITIFAQFHTGAEC